VRNNFIVGGKNQIICGKAETFTTFVDIRGLPMNFHIAIILYIGNAATSRHSIKVATRLFSQG
jgi:hypothetical protein